jgi:hypothetical protein
MDMLIRTCARGSLVGLLAATAVAFAASAPAKASDGQGQLVPGGIWAERSEDPNNGLAQELSILSPAIDFSNHPEATWYEDPGAVDLYGQDTSWGNRVQLYPSNGTRAQKWTFVRAGVSSHPQSDYYKIKPSFNSSVCLDRVVGNGDRAVIYGCDPNWHNQSNQLWKAVPTSDGWFKLVTQYDIVNGTGKALTVGSDSGTPRLEMQTFTGSDRQRFRFYKPQIWLDDSVEFPDGTYRVESERHCPHPYLYEEIEENSVSEPSNGQDLVPGDVRIHNITTLNVASEEHSRERFSIHYFTRPQEARTGQTRFACNLVY